MSDCNSCPLRSELHTKVIQLAELFSLRGVAACLRCGSMKRVQDPPQTSSDLEYEQFLVDLSTEAGGK